MHLPKRHFLSLFLLFSSLYFLGCQGESSTANVSKDVPVVKSIAQSDIVYLTFETAYTALTTGERSPVQVWAYDKNATKYDVSHLVFFETSNNNVITLSGTVCEASQKGQSSLIASYAGIKASKTFSVHTAIKPNTHKPHPFIDKYVTSIPEDATIENYDSQRFAVLTGVIQDKIGVGIENVRVWIKKHPEYGSVLSDAQGKFALATQASGLQIVDYQKKGYTPLQRAVKTYWNAIVKVDDVMMLTVDVKSTYIDLREKDTLLHESSTIVDGRGKRSATIVFDGITEANVVLADGNSYILKKFNVRATEFTTPESMPASLPSSSAFTYCIDVTLDGVPDDAMVYFDNNVTFFIDNFLEMPVGAVVPVGYYSRSQSQWIAMNNGIIVKLLDENGDGVVDGLDYTGDDVADDLNNDGNTSDEVIGLEDSTRYLPNQTYTLFYSNHFTSIDSNYGPGRSDDSKDQEDAKENEDDGDCQADNYNSYVNPGDRTFHEDVNIPGTDYTLWYNTKDTKGYKIKLKLQTTESNIGSLGASFRVDIAGKEHSDFFSSVQMDGFNYYWDRSNYLSETVDTPQIARFTIGKLTANYNYMYYLYNDLNRNFLDVSNRLFGEDIRGYTDALSAVKTLSSSRYLLSAQKAQRSKVYPGLNTNNIANGWNFEGLIETKNTLVPTVQNTNNSKVYFTSTSNMPDFISPSGRFYYVGWWNYRCASYSYNAYLARKIAIDDADNIYRVCNNGSSQYIKKFASDGTVVEKYIGGGTQPYVSDDNLSDLAFGSDIDFTIDDDGNIIITDTNNHKIYKRFVTGQLRRIIGNDAGDVDGAFFEAQLNQPTEPTSDSKGNIYFIDQGNKKIKKATGNGEVLTLTGQAQSDTHTGDGGLASTATMPLPTHLTTDAKDNLYIGFSYHLSRNTINSYKYNERIRMISPQGYIYSIVGEESSISPWFNRRSVKGKNANINYFFKTMNMFIDPQGRIRVGPYTITPNSSVSVNSAFVFDESTQQYTYQSGSTLKIFDSNHNHIKTIDTEQNATLYTFTYTEQNKLQTITDRYGKVTTIEYAGTTPLAIVAPTGDRLTLEVDEQRNLVGVSYPDGQTQSFTYDDNNLMTQMTQPNGNSFTHVYDAHGRLQTFSDEEGGAWTYDISIDDSTNSRTITKTSALGNKRVKTYTTSVNGTRSMTQTDSDGSISTKSSDGKTFKSQSCGVETKRLSVAYNEAEGSLSSTSTVNASTGTATLKSCSLSMTKQTTIDENNPKIKTSSTQLLKSANPSYCANPQVYATAFEEKTLINTDYTTNTTTITTPENRTLTSTFDALTQQTTKAEQAGTLPVSYTYDSEGKLLTTTQGNRVTTNIYNDKNDLITTVDTNGVPTSYTYDEMHRAIEVSRAGQVVQYTYDANGNLESTTTPNQATFEETSNKINYPSTFKSPLGFTKSYTYTVERELASITLPSSKTIEYTYLKEHLTTQTTPETTTTYTYGCGGLLTEVHNDHGENTLYTYDDLKRVTALSYTGQVNQTLSYTNYHPLHNLPQSITYAGDTQTLQYDKDALLIQAGDYALSRESDSGQLTSITNNSYTQTFSYNDYGERNSKADSFNSTNLYRYEILNRTLSGKIESKVEQTSTHQETLYQYTYDIAGRLTKVKTNGQTTESYKYDHNGNRLEATVNNTTTKAYYTIEDQLEVYGQNTYRYDDDGYIQEKTTPEGSTTYSYGTLGELKEVNLPTSTGSVTVISYTHNANNQRVSKEVNGTTVEKYLWENLTTLLAVYDADDNLKQRFEYVNGRMPVSMTDSGGIKYYLHYDQVGTLKAISDTNGNIVKEVTYDTFGHVLTDTDEDFKVPFGFAGGLYDQDTQLTRFGYRDYDATTGKWTAKDPIGFSGGDMNLYGYVLGDPVNKIDPMGLMWPFDNNSTLSKEEAEKLNKRNRGYGSIFDKPGHSLGQTGVNIQTSVSCRNYYACIPAMGKKKCGIMFPCEEKGKCETNTTK
jgi:RHS repeat-associated protein